MKLRRGGLVCLAIVATLVARPASAQQSDIIRGRVTGPDSAPIPNVRVTATSYAGQIAKTARTDKNGRFMIAFLNGEGDYWLEFAALGFVARRFEIKRVGDEEIMLADTRLVSAIAALDAVNVVGQRNRALVNRNATAGDVGGGDRPLTNDVLSPDQAGNLAAMAAAVAGMQLIPGLDGASDMFSALGLSGDQNNTTFNGLGSGINALPPDAQVRLSLNQYPWDVSKGGFSGAQISITSVPGTNYSRRSLSGSGTGPPLEWTDLSAGQAGQKSTQLYVGGAALGPIARDARFYNSSYYASRTFSDALTLLNASPAGLTTAGVAGDSVARLLDILRARHVPVSVPGVPSSRTTDNVRLQTNIDFSPSASGTGNSFTLGALGGYTRAQLIGTGGTLLTAVPARAAENRNWSGSASLTHANYFGFGILSQSALAFAATSSSTQPYLDYPQGSVRVTSALPDRSTAIRSLAFGGGRQPASSRTKNVQLSNQLSWYSSDNKHTFKLTSVVGRESNERDDDIGGLGLFSFNSLADLASGTPASFSRTLAPTRVDAGQVTASTSLGDAWRPRSNLQVQYGLRLDANRFVHLPEFNAAVNDAFGIRTSSVPNRVYASPRIGMQWFYGDAPQVAFVAGAARPPRAVIHAGLGIFQNVGAASLISPAVSATGLPSSTQTITCVGSAVPFPDWDAYRDNPGAAPTRCADGTAGTVFSTQSPDVVAFDRGFEQPRAFRAAADWTSAVLDNRFALGLQAVYSWNMNQVGSVDANLDSRVRFTLDDENKRPIFADPASIIPGTGSIAPQATRVSPAFQRVSLLRSDLHSASRALIARVVPVTSNPKWKWDLTYSLLDVRDQFYGFSSTVGNPFDRAWGPHLASGRHQFLLGWNSFPIFDLAYVTVRLQVKSGARFTPSIAGDVNGDGGFGNDRAFVFDPARTSDSVTATAMRSLLAGAAPAVRSCLENQLGQLAARGSCQAPWVTTAGLRINFNAQKIGLPRRMNLVLNLTNPFGIVDLALHGSGGVRGWGQEIAPDPSLLFVRGFDPVTRTFKYEVNQRFGSTAPREVVQRTPAYMSIGVNLDIGMPRERQILTQTLDAGRGRPGARQSASNLKILGTNTIPNPMGLILQQPESLQLTRKQTDTLATLSRLFTLYADSVWVPVSTYLESLPERYDRGEAYRRYVGARERTVDFLIEMVPRVNEVLTASQRRKLPPQLLNYLDLRVLRFLRSSTAGDASALIVR